MMELFLKLLFVIYTCGCSSNGAESDSKRLLLHSEDDLVQTVLSLQTRLTAMETELATLKATMSTTPNPVGSTYVRWGRTTCPGNGTEFIYNGFMAGSKWDHTGGGANAVCLPETPSWNKYVDGHQSGTRIYGTEIEIDGAEGQLLFSKNVYNEDIPCSVCRAPRASHVMIPARASCYAGWTTEYQGYLASASDGWKNNADYICLDSGLEFVPHGAANDEEHVINIVEVQCGSQGSLPCPPYVDGRELACVVCTK